MQSCLYSIKKLNMNKLITILAEQYSIKNTLYKVERVLLQTIVVLNVLKAHFQQS